MQAHTVCKLQITENLTKSQSQHVSRILLAGWDVMYGGLEFWLISGNKEGTHAVQIPR